MKRGLLFITGFLLLGSMLIVSAITLPPPACAGIGTNKACLASCTNGYQSSSGTCGTGLVCCAVNQSWDTIMKLSVSSNAHGEVWNETHYNVIISYSDIFRASTLLPGQPYSGSEPHACKSSPTNGILKLSEATNAHGANWSSTTYPINICYGNLSCAARTDNCLGDEKCVVTIATNTGEPTTNGHLATCTSVTGYPVTKICCNASSAAPVVLGCTDYTTRDACWSGYPTQNCTWTPRLNSTGKVTTTNANGGHCCPETYEWDAGDGMCRPTGSLCTVPWIKGITQVAFDAAYGPFKKVAEKYYYCAQISSGINTGFWYEISSY